MQQAKGVGQAGVGSHRKTIPAVVCLESMRQLRGKGTVPALSAPSVRPHLLAHLHQNRITAVRDEKHTKRVAISLHTNLGGTESRTWCLSGWLSPGDSSGAVVHSVHSEALLLGCAGPGLTLSKSLLLVSSKDHLHSCHFQCAANLWELQFTMSKSPVEPTALHHVVTFISCLCHTPEGQLAQSV